MKNAFFFVGVQFDIEIRKRPDVNSEATILRKKKHCIKKKRNHPSYTLPRLCLFTLVPAKIPYKRY